MAWPSSLTYVSPLACSARQSTHPRAAHLHTFPDARVPNLSQYPRRQSTIRHMGICSDVPGCVHTRYLDLNGNVDLTCVPMSQDFINFLSYSGPGPCVSVSSAPCLCIDLGECRGSVMKVVACRQCSPSKLHTHMLLNAGVLLSTRAFSHLPCVQRR